MQHLLTELQRKNPCRLYSSILLFMPFPQSAERMLQMFSFKHSVSCQLDKKKSLWKGVTTFQNEVY